MTREQALRTLGLGKSPTRGEITSAYRKLVSKLHPDKNSSNLSKFLETKEAYEFLKKVGIKKGLSEIRELICPFCYANLTLSLAERRRDCDIVCPQCKKDFSLDYGLAFYSSLSTITSGNCPSCNTSLAFDVNARVPGRLISCANCNEEFYINEINGEGLLPNTPMFCSSCYEPLVLNLKERRGDCDIFCSSCNTETKFREFVLFNTSLSPYTQGECPNCCVKLQFPIGSRIPDELIECPDCKESFYLEEAENLTSEAIEQSIAHKRRDIRLIEGRNQFNRGLLVLAIGIVVTFISYSTAEDGGTYILTSGAIFWGLWDVIAGFLKMS